MKSVKNRTIIVVVGQTASGKSDLAVKLARDFGGEVISADSRQVYKEFTLTSGKITKEEMFGIKHHLLDVCSIKDKTYSAFDFFKDAGRSVEFIFGKKKIPIIAGGTGFYIDVLLGRIKLESAPTDELLREKLKGKTVSELYGILVQLSPEISENIDKNNPIRLIRAIERVKASQKTKSDRIMPSSLFLETANIIWIGLKWDKETLRERIKIRLLERYKQGMCNEIKELLDDGFSKERIDNLGLEMRYCIRFLTGVLDEKCFLEELENKIWQYAKRQATYWKRNKEIKWFSPKEYDKILSYIKSHIK